jgi:hypothetical protein
MTIGYSAIPFNIHGTSSDDESVDERIENTSTPRLEAPAPSSDDMDLGEPASARRKRKGSLWGKAKDIFSSKKDDLEMDSRTEGKTPRPKNSPKEKGVLVYPDILWKYYIKLMTPDFNKGSFTKEDDWIILGKATYLNQANVKEEKGHLEAVKELLLSAATKSLPSFVLTIDMHASAIDDEFLQDLVKNASAENLKYLQGKFGERAYINHGKSITAIRIDI